MKDSFGTKAPLIIDEFATLQADPEVVSISNDDENNFATYKLFFKSV